MSNTSRVVEVDALRGLAIVLMTLDHVRGFIGVNNIDLTDPYQTTVGLFLTRYVTHLCAPIFVLLAGAGARFSLTKSSRPEIAGFLLKRGIWLVFLELTVIDQAWGFGFSSPIRLQVIWALGAAMIALSILIFLPDSLLAVLSLTIMIGHNILDGFSNVTGGSLSWLWNIFHNPGLIDLGLRKANTYYPILPWIGLMIFGWIIGPVFGLPEKKRRAVLLASAFSMLLIFVFLRSLGGYGDPYSSLFLSHSGEWPSSLMAFLRVQKYPPSLQYLLITLSVATFAYLGLEAFSSKVKGYLATFGKVPFFFYILHLFVLHSLAMLIVYLRDGHVSLDWSSYGPQALRLSLPVVYAGWILTVASLYPFSKWFAGVKSRHKKWWLRYL
jgi:uncharacterized membrane protein